MPGVRETINSSFTACRIGLRKCWQWIQCHKPIVFILQDQYNVLCLGLSGAGKTTLLSHLVDEPLANCEPTRGFNIKTLPIKNTVISIKELGGSFHVQPFWDHYFGNKHGILFVVDSTDSDEELNTAKEALRVVLADQRLTGKPCLILGKCLYQIVKVLMSKADNFLLKATPHVNSPPIEKSWQFEVHPQNQLSVRPICGLKIVQCYLFQNGFVT